MDTLTDRPEELYRKTTDDAERKRIRALAIRVYQDLVFSVVRRSVDRQHWPEAMQAGAVGILIALNKWDPERIGEDRGHAFWFFARRWVQDEIQKWIDRGVYWRPRSRGRAASHELSALHRNPVSLDAPAPAAVDTNLYSLFPANQPSIEELAADAELRGRLFQFAATLTNKEREILFSENAQRMGTRRYLDLVERARAFLKGASDVRNDGRGSV